MASTRVILSHPWRNGNLLKFDADDENLGLSEVVQKIARKELREDKSAREQCLQQFKEWLKKCEDVENIRSDDTFLLRFLRAKKFSVPMAEQLLLKYLNLKKVFPEMTAHLDFMSSPVHEMFSKGYLVVSPIRDQHGRRVIIARAANFNPHLHHSSLQAKAHFIALETLLEDTTNQVVGFTHIGDMHGITAAHITNWKPSDFARILKWGEQSWPARHKAIHCVNVPSTVKFVLDFAKSRVSSKIKDRFMTHTNLKELHKHIDPACLPKELGGTIPLAEMAEMWMLELAGKRDILVDLDKMKLLSDKNIVSKRDRINNNNSLQAHVDSVAGSFRKLEVD